MREWWQKYWGAPFAVVMIPVMAVTGRGFWKLYNLWSWYSPTGEPDRFPPGALTLASVVAVVVTAGLIVNGVVNATPKPKPPVPTEPQQSDWK